MQRNNGWFWLSVGLGAAGIAATSILVYRFYKLEQRRHLEAHDPRARQVRALIEEAEKLIHLGRKGSVGNT
jgi:hypothetical protein